MIIDVWGQVLTPRMAQAPWLAPLLRWTGQDPSDVRVTPELALRAMDASGVDMMLLSAWSAPEGWLISNDELDEQISVAPDRFKGMLSVDISKPSEAARTIRERFDGERYVAVRILPWVWNLPPNHAWYYPVYAACVEVGAPFCTQIGHTGPLRRSEVGRLIPYLEDVLIDFPDLVVVGGHVGFPWIDELTSLTVKFPNLYVDTSAYALHRLPPDFVAYMRGVGKDRVIFGTNWPMIDPGHCLKGLDSLSLAPDQQEYFLSGLAKKVFKLD